MAPILAEKLTGWYDDNGHEYLKVTARCLLTLLWYLIASVGIYTAIIWFCLSVRSLRFIFGKRFAPDGRMAIVVTGATSGFGLGISKRMYKLGFTVFACYYNDQELGYSELLKLKDETKNKTNGLHLISMDIRSRESIQQARKQIEIIMDKDNLKLHCLLNNAGVAIDGPFELMTHDNIRNIIDTNLTGAIAVAKEFVLRIIKDKGRILNVSSGMSKFQCRRWSLYCATKVAIKVFSDSFHEDLEPYGASCHTVIPGSLILHSNFCWPRLRQLQQNLRQLSDEERTTYAESVEIATTMARSSIKYKLKNISNEEAEKLAKIFNIQLDEVRNCRTFKDSKEYKKRWFPERILRRLFRLFAGGYSVDTHIEDTYYMQGYEDSIRMINPPRYIYVGNRYFHYFLGPLTDYMPQVILYNVFNTLVLHMLEETD